MIGEQIRRLALLSGGLAKKQMNGVSQSTVLEPIFGTCPGWAPSNERDAKDLARGRLPECFEACGWCSLAGNKTEGEGMPPLNLWAINESGEQRKQVMYSEQEQAAHSLHFETTDNVRLFGSTAFIYYPSRSWQARTFTPRASCPVTEIRSK